jgi:hypothetical protein
MSKVPLQCASWWTPPSLPKRKHQNGSIAKQMAPIQSQWLQRVPNPQDKAPGCGQHHMGTSLIRNSTSYRRGVRNMEDIG